MCKKPGSAAGHRARVATGPGIQRGGAWATFGAAVSGWGWDPHAAQASGRQVQGHLGFCHHALLEEAIQQLL